MDILNTSFDIFGILISFGFIWITIKSGRSLVGSFFKKYYWLMTVAAIIFGFGFLIEPIGGFLGFNDDVIDTVHHVFLIAAAIMFVCAGIVFPKEAAKLTGNE